MCVTDNCIYRPYIINGGSLVILFAPRNSFQFSCSMSTDNIAVLFYSGLSAEYIIIHSYTRYIEDV